MNYSRNRLLLLGLLLLPMVAPEAFAQPERKSDTFVTEYLDPVAIVWKQGIENGTNLLLPYSGQVSTTEPVVTLFRKGDAVLLDFGKEIQGRIQIVRALQDEKTSSRFRVRLGESVSEAMSDVETSSATNDHAMRDFTLEVPWLGVAESGRSGFRFARIDLLDDGPAIPIVAVRAASEYRDLPWKGAFHCSDPRLDAIWETGAYTVQLNMQEYLWDGIKRDRLVWIGDMHPEVMTIHTVFGGQDVIRRSLDYVRDHTAPDQWMNNMCSYSMWWVIIHRDMYRYEGDLDYLREQHAYLQNLLPFIISNIDGGKENFHGGTRFLDWPTSEIPDVIHAGLQGLAIMTLEAGEELCRALDDEVLEKKCRRAAAQLAKHVPDACGNNQAAAMLSLAGLVSPSAAASVILRNGTEAFSSFYGYYMLEALARAGEYDAAMRFISEYWGGMLDLGATTFWEDFSYPDKSRSSRIDRLLPEGAYDIHGEGGAYCYEGFRLSMCHGWASGPTSWLSRYVLGISPAAPGFSKVKIDPHLGSLEWAGGSFPTPYGEIRVVHRKKADGTVESEIELPENIEIVPQNLNDEKMVCIGGGTPVGDAAPGQDRKR